MTDNDQQLERLLRNVKVPDDLKASLLKITDKPTQLPRASERNGANNGFAMKAVGMIALAASLVLVSLFFINPFGKERSITAKTPFEQLVEPKESEQQKGSAPTAASLLQQMSANSLEFNSSVIQQNIELLETLVAQQKSHQPEISQMELASVAMSIANQAGVDYGNNIDSVRKDLRQIMTEYPGTTGADMAVLFLEQTKQKSEF